MLKATCEDVKIDTARVDLKLAWNNYLGRIGVPVIAVE